MTRTPFNGGGVVAMRWAQPLWRCHLHHDKNANLDSGQDCGNTRDLVLALGPFGLE